MFEISTIEFAKMQCFLQNKKSLGSGPNVPYLDILDGKTSVIYTVEFAKTQCFLQNKKCLGSVPNTLYLDILNGKTSFICTL